jgi:hypothetical protein
MTALLRQLPDTELVNEYRPGGLHPVHLGDKFHDGRYEVKRKLGCGAFGTVWLVQDHVASGFAALKVMRADADRRELGILRHLKTKCADIDDYVVRLLDNFEHTGPNGVHQCIVTEVLGPSLAGIEDDLEDSFPDEVLPPDVAQSISLQIARGLARLHVAGVVHGGEWTRPRIRCQPANDVQISPSAIYFYVLQLSPGGKPLPMSMSTCSNHRRNPCVSMKPASLQARHRTGPRIPSTAFSRRR